MPSTFIPAPNTASVEMIWRVNNVICENQFHVTKGSPYTLAQLQAVRGIANTWDSGSYSGLRCAGATLERIRTRALDSAASQVEDFSLPTPRAGAIGVSCLSNNVAFCVKLATTTAGRSFRGRWYVTGMSALALATNTNQLTPTAVIQYTASLNALMAAMAAGGHTLCVVSYRADGAPRTTAVVTAASGFVAVDANVDSQRRRLTGRGI